MTEESSSSSPKMVALKTADGNVFKVEPTIVKEMQTVQSSFMDGDAAVTTDAILLPNVFARELTRIIEYSRQHRLLREAKDFDAEFVKSMSDDELRGLILAARHLNMKDLLNFLSEAIARRIENKSVESVRKFFGLVNDYTPEEEAKLREEYAWAFEGVEDDRD